MRKPSPLKSRAKAALLLALLLVAWPPAFGNASESTPAHPRDTITTQFSIMFRFTKDAYAIEATAGAGGYISPEGRQLIPAGTDAAFSFTVAPGYAFGRLMVDDVVISEEPVASHLFERVLLDHTIHVEFVPLPGDPSPTAFSLSTASPTGVPVVVPASPGAIAARATDGYAGTSTGRAAASPLPSPVPSPSPGAVPPDRDDIPPVAAAPKNLGTSMD